ncbi:MAG: transcriptional regulator [Verrucomicrobia bacterium]|nr:transcriptional regulator [Verrucomicrobiota bacterium]
MGLRFSRPVLRSLAGRGPRHHRRLPRGRSAAGPAGWRAFLVSANAPGRSRPAAAAAVWCGPGRCRHSWQDRGRPALDRAHVGGTVRRSPARGWLLHAAGHSAVWLGVDRGSLNHPHLLDSSEASRRGATVGQRDHGRGVWAGASGLRRLPAGHRETEPRALNPTPFLQLDRVIHEKGRLPIMSLLAANPSLAFTEIRDTLKMTDGNLAVHLRTLQEAGYVAITKSFHDRRPLTTCHLTEAGRAAFRTYINLLEQIVRQAKQV